MMDKMPRSSKESEAFLRLVLPDNPEITLRPMFGNLAAFVNGNMSLGVFGEDLFLRLPQRDGDELLKAKGAGPFEPIKGRGMKGYSVVPRAWIGNPDKVKPWAAKALAWTRTLLPKAKKR